MNVGDIARRLFIKAAPKDPILPLLSAIQEEGLGKALVFKGDTFEGIVSKETFIESLIFMEDKSLTGLTVEDFILRDVMTVNDDDDIYEGVDKLLTTSTLVDAVPVLSNGIVTGYVTSKEYLKLFVKSDWSFKVKDLMHYDITTCYDYTPFDRLLRDVTESGFKHVMVLMGKKLTGVIAVKDLILAIINSHEHGAKAFEEMTAEQFMTPDPITVEGNVDVRQAADLMLEHKIGGLPVVEDDELKGIFTRRDILKAYEIKQQ